MKKTFALLLTFLLLFTCSCTVTKIENTSSTPRVLDYNIFDYEDFSPYVKLGEYKGIEYVYGDLTVTDEEFLDRKEYYLYSKGFSELVNVTDRAVKENDYVDISYVCKVDGEEYRTSESSEFYVGHSDFLEGFDENIIGMMIGETKEFKVPFPDDYDQSVAGKDAVFTVSLKTVKETVFEEVTDEIAKTVLGDQTATAESFTKYINDEILNEKYEAAEYQMRVDIWTEVYKNAEIIELPEREYKTCFDDAMASYNYQVQSKYNVTLEEFCKQYGEEIAYYENLATGNARQFTSEQLVVFAIAKLEGITLSEDEVNEYAETNYKASGYSSAKEFMEINEFYVRAMAMQEKVIEKLITYSVKTEAPTSSEVTSA